MNDEGNPSIGGLNARG